MMTPTRSTMITSVIATIMVAMSGRKRMLGML